jgi:hypothetical protein
MDIFEDAMMRGSYHYKGNRYTFLGIVTLKEPATGVWVKAVSYSPHDDPCLTYVREFKDFRNKFKKFYPMGHCREGVEL